MALGELSFAFDTSKGETPETVKRKRMLAEAILGQASRAPKDVGEGLNAIGQALLYRKMMSDAGKGEAAGGSAASKIFQSLMGANFPAPPPAATVAPTPSASTTTGDVSVRPSPDASPAMAFAPPQPQNATDGPAASWLRYTNEGATRNKPLSPELVSALGSVLPDLGLTMKVFSGGQDASGPHRTGSHRHDYGNAADAYFYKDGRKLDWSNPEDLPVFEQLVSRAKAAGITGIGAGPGYMSQGTMHLGFGTPLVWGAGGKSANAPEWLRKAYAGAPAGSSAVAALDRQASGAMAAAVPSPNADASLPAGMRNFNPGNLKYDPAVAWDGLVGPSQNTDQGDPQAVFQSPEMGMRAAAKLALNKYTKGMTTANQLIAGEGGWTPGNTQAAANIARSIGVGPDDDLGLTDPAKAQRFLRALVTQEHGPASQQYGDDLIRNGVQLAYGPEGGQQVASLDPGIGMITPRQPGEGEGAQPRDPGATSPGAIELLKRMMSQAPMGGQFPSIAPPQMAQSAPPAPQAVSPSERVAQAMMPAASNDPGAGPWGASLSQADAATRAGPSMEQLMQAASDPWVAQKYGGIIEALLQQKMKASDPLTQLQIEKAKRELAAPPERKTAVVNGRLVDTQTGQEIANFPDSQKPIEKWQKLDDNTLYDPATGETKNIGGNTGGGDLFKGNSVEAQSLNGLVRSGQLTPDQAMQLGAGKTITDPSTGAIIFLTPQGVFGQPANGGQAQPVGPPPPAAAPQVAPPVAPGAGAAPTAPVAPAATDAARPGQIQLTDGKGAKPPTESQARNGAIGRILLNEVPTVGANFKALSDPTGQLLSTLPMGLGNPWQSEEYQRAAAAVKTSVSNVLYSLSGASSNPGEVINQIGVLTPQFGDKPAVIKDKLNRFKTYVRAIVHEANDPQLVQSVEDAIKQMDAPAGEPKAQGDAPATPKTDEEYNALPSGALFVDPEDNKTYRKP